MPAKTPIYLKTSTPKRGKKPKLRDVLSREMISPPLGDFRHSAHIGLDGEGDMFGELSFLQGKYDLIPNMGQKFTILSTDTSLDEEFHSDAISASYRPFLKNAVSLPAFSAPNSKDRAPPKPPRLHLEETPGLRSVSISYGERCFSRDENVSFASIPLDQESSNLVPYDSLSEGSINEDGAQSFCSTSDRMQENKDNQLTQEQGIPKSESLSGLQLDLGPSILEDVLRIMDDYKL
ncbi:MGC80350 protein [Xenopus laevis]|uniref:MGC80350 protein n=2 Tax=Xenopus laevis TaxID=8355 RepID=Q6GQ47_XENLA|nr:uncharacterized protein LOC443961 [Xenopus laevis]AAH72901.1 MGC80350 protein [Xenopus laevis]OCT66245.1 hypothetical protein XELAEV_18042503mg [Xenopus laevis]